MMKVSKSSTEPDQKSIGMTVVFFFLIMGVLTMMILKGGV